MRVSIMSGGAASRSAGIFSASTQPDAGGSAGAGAGSGAVAAVAAEGDGTGMAGCRSNVGGASTVSRRSGQCAGQRRLSRDGCPPLCRMWRYGNDAEPHSVPCAGARYGDAHWGASIATTIVAAAGSLEVVAAVCIVLKLHLFAVDTGQRMVPALECQCTLALVEVEPAVRVDFNSYTLAFNHYNKMIFSDKLLLRVQHIPW